MIPGWLVGHAPVWLCARYQLRMEFLCINITDDQLLHKPGDFMKEFEVLKQLVAVRRSNLAALCDGLSGRHRGENMNESPHTVELVSLFIDVVDDTQLVGVL